MAYSLGDRFPPPPKYFTLLDPGSYSQNYTNRTKQNAAPFLSKTPRVTLDVAKLWTQTDYDQRLPSNIPNCSSMLSKKPRFPYEAFGAEDLEEILCKCGIQTPCECPTGDYIAEDVVCQGKVTRRLYKGPAPRSHLGDEGLSTPSRNDKGFIITSDGTQHRIRDEIKEESPPFYDATVNESTAFYQGCKWSNRTARDFKRIEVRPGPADYFIERDPTRDEICGEKVRALKRKTSKQLRFIEMVQRRNILENLPSPATYRPRLPKCTDLQFLGSKAERFPNSKLKYDISPGPAHYLLRRDFDAIEPPEILCHAKLPEPACFSMKGKRFKIQREEGPSPATYKINFKIGNFVNCRTAPFGCSARRFKQEIIEESNDDEIVEPLNKEKLCILPTWEFKSKTIRMKPLIKKHDEPSPADYLPKRNSIEKSAQLKPRIPFDSSEGRLEPWYSWTPVHGMLKTPGPGYYCLEKPRCFPAFKRGPLYRAKRFPNIYHKAPPPNAYKVCNGIETILATHNQKLKDNIENQHKFIWEQPNLKDVLSFEERENIILKRCISLLDTKYEVENEMTSASKPLTADAQPDKKGKKAHAAVNKKPKMLRYFLYAHPIPVWV